MKILIIGDSFAADWSVKYSHCLGWPNLLASQHDVTNLAQAGVGEYKIYQQLVSVVDRLSEFDLIIVSHTSPYRVHTRQHPIHSNGKLHKNADLIYSDIEYHSKTVAGFFNRSLRSAMGFFNHHFDSEYQDTIYKLLRDQIDQIINNIPCIIVNDIIAKVSSPGLINHLSEQGNQSVATEIFNLIRELHDQTSTRKL